jgi:hypothetical protein
MGTFVTGLLEEVRQLGVEIAIVNGIVAVRPAKNLPARLREQLRTHKPEILEALRSRPATCGPTCYEIEPGRRIHHPWHACKTPFPPKTANPVPQAECKHCGGAGECPHPCCTLRRTEEPVPCLMCQPQKRRVWLAATRPETCWHCGGARNCRCIVCGERCPAGASGECTVCRGSGKAQVWVQ